MHYLKKKEDDLEKGKNPIPIKPDMLCNALEFLGLEYPLNLRVDVLLPERRLRYLAPLYIAKYWPDNPEYIRFLMPDASEINEKAADGAVEPQRDEKEFRPSETATENQTGQQLVHDIRIHVQQLTESRRWDIIRKLRLELIDVFDDIVRRYEDEINYRINRILDAVVSHYRDATFKEGAPKLYITDADRMDLLAFIKDDNQSLERRQHAINVLTLITGLTDRQILDGMFSQFQLNAYFIDRVVELIDERNDSYLLCDRIFDRCLNEELDDNRFDYFVAKHGCTLDLQLTLVRMCEFGPKLPDYADVLRLALFNHITALRDAPYSADTIAAIKQLGAVCNEMGCWSEYTEDILSLADKANRANEKFRRGY